MADVKEDAATIQPSGQPQPPDLTIAETIKRLYETYTSKKKNEGSQKWLAAYAAILVDVRNSSPEQLASAEFRKRLWGDNPVSSSGADGISVKEILESRELAEWIGGVAKTSLPPRGPERIKLLEGIHEELLKRVKPLTATRTPKLRVLRVMATLFPEDYSNVTSDYRLQSVGRAMFGRLPKEERESMTRVNARILDRFTTILGPTDGTPEQLAIRNDFVWFLWEAINAGKDPELPENADSGDTEEPLVFPPVGRRLRGVSPIPDPMATILETVEFVSRNRASRGAVVEFIVSQHPNVQKNSASQYLNCMWNTFDMFQLNGETLELTKAAKLFLNSEDPDILIRPLLTKSIGPDLVLWRLNQQGPTPRMDLIKALQNHYRRWTSTFMPNSILSWGRSFDLWAAETGGKYALTERGKKWAARMTSEPHAVNVVAETNDGEDETETPIDTSFSAPSLGELLDVFRNGPLVIPDDVIIRMHAALHANDSKHFVLLSGLSGTGKTRIAIEYACAFHRVDRGKPNPYLCLIPVQPDWTDSTGLLGYVNPLGGEASYVRTECLKFLLAAHEHPVIPHFLCLDEMNLARVEYYFAPFLSAMETDGRLYFHYEDLPIDNVPPFIPWPKNLYIFGTVNMDETTHAFSDKVLDRAFTIEFWDVDLDEYAKRFADDKDNQGYPSDLLLEVLGALKEAAEVLRDIHQHFGYRTAGEVLGFMGACGDSMPRVKAIDQAILMKVLPKIRGQDTEPVRQALDRLCNWADKRGFCITLKKLRTMTDELRSTGTTRFWR